MLHKAACFCDSSSRRTAVSSAASRVVPSSWVVARREQGAVVRGVGIEGRAEGVEGRGPRILNRCPDVASSASS